MLREVDTIDEDLNPMQFVDGNGDLYVWLWKNNIPSKKYIKNLVAEAFINNPNGYTNVGFRDGNNKNCHADNLYWKK